MAGLVGGAASGAVSKPQYTGIPLQTSANGLAIPIVWGQTVVSPNLIWYNDFTAIKHSAQQGGKGGTPTSVTYTYTAAVLLALCEGPIHGVGTVWTDKSASTLSTLQLGLMNGSSPQTVWGYLTSKHPDQALSYPGTAMLAASSYDLGSSAGLPNHKVEVEGVFWNTGDGVLPDADPSRIVLDFLTNPQYGLGFPSENIDLVSLQTGPASYQAYCQTTSLWLSPALINQEAARSTLTRWLQLTNSAAFWSGDLLKIVPYGDTATTANGYTYTPDVTPIYDLDDDDYVCDGTVDPVQVARKDPADCKNWVKLEILDRTNSYATDPIEAKDSASIDLVGALPADQITAHEICDPNVAAIAAQLILQRSVYIRNNYKFTLGWEYCLLEPMDLVTLTDIRLGMNKLPVRITSIEEDDQGNLMIEAEEFPAGVATASLYAKQPRSAYQANFKSAPGSVNTPVIFEPSVKLSNGTQQVWVSVSGGTNWGGCAVHLSSDNVSYVRIGEVTVPGRLGSTTSSLAIESDPDTVSVLGITIAESAGATLLSGTQADADDGHTLIYVDGELMAYETAALTGPGAYNLSYLRRGLYDTAIGAHAPGSAFARLDGTQFEYDLPTAQIGRTIYLKFTSFNIYGAAEEDISTVAAYPYTPTGAGAFIGQPLNLTISQGVLASSLGMQVDLQLNWTAPATSWVTDYQVSYRLDGGPWTTAKTGGLLQAIIPQVLAGTYEVQVWALGLDYQSAPAAISYTVDTNDIVLPAVTGLELSGQGNDTIFAGEDAKFDWRLNSAYGASEALGAPDGANAGFLDVWFQNFNVVVTDPNGVFLRSETTTNPAFTYTYLKNVADGGAGGPNRDFTVTVTWRDTINQSSLPASLSVTNPPPPVPTSINIQVGVGTVFIDYVPPGDVDWVGVQVYLSETEGFTPGPATLVYDGPDTFITVPCSFLVNSYIRIAAYDVFGKTGLNFSDEFTALAGYAVDTTPPAVPVGLAATTTIEVALDGTQKTWMNLTWTANGEPDFLQYQTQVRQQNGDGSWGNWLTGTVGGVSTVSTRWPALPNVEYQIELRASDISGNWSAWSAALTYTTAKDTVAPPTLSGGAAIGGFGFVELGWTPSGADDYANAIVYAGMDAIFAHAVQVGTPPGSSFVVTGLGPDETVYLWVSPVDTSGNIGAVAGPYSATTTLVNAAAMGAASVTASSVSTNLIITSAANIGSEVVADANILNLDAAKLIAGSVLTGGVVISAAYAVGITTVGAVAAQAADPLTVANGATTRLNPGLVEISGGTTLADWRNGGDNTRIDGGAIAANTVSANKVTIGNRGITVDGLVFSPQAPQSNQTNWSAGHVTYVNDAGAVTTVAVAAGNATYAGSIIYVYWTAGATTLATTTSAATASGDAAICFATLTGDGSFNANYSQTIIDGSTIYTGSVKAGQIDTTTAVISVSAQIANGIIQTAHIGTAQITHALIASVDASSITVGLLNASQITPGSIGDIEQNYISTQYDLIANGVAAGTWFNFQTTPVLPGNGVAKFLVTAACFYGLGVAASGGTFMQIRLRNNAGVVVSAANIGATIASSAGSYGCSTIPWVAQPAGSDTYYADVMWGGDTPTFAIVQNRLAGFTRLAV